MYRGASVPRHLGPRDRGSSVTFRVLGLESSCDETAAAIVEDGHLVRSDVVASQHDVHARYGGVVPELASRAHILNVVPVVQAALDRAAITLEELDGIAVTNAPGLVGALLVGLQTAKAIAWVTELPLVGVHHLEGHLSAIYLEPEPPPMPHLALIVSGGHTSLVRVNDHGKVIELGATRDDAAGEAFDKGAKLLGLGYPGGIVIDTLAKTGDPRKIAFPARCSRASTAMTSRSAGSRHRCCITCARTVCPTVKRSPMSVRVTRRRSSRCSFARRVGRRDGSASRTSRSVAGSRRTRRCVQR